ncbi:MAG: DUF2953 domain-containing protein [Clostridia bacterium]|nr:DUF2953 domain-containing protein [Clostridia bacterium]
MRVQYKEKKTDISLRFGIVKINLSGKKKKKTKKKSNAEKKEKKSENKTIDKENDIGGFQKFLALLQAFYDTSVSIRKTIEVEKLEIDALYGNADAAFTGMAVGFAYAEIYKLIGFLATIFTVRQPAVTIKPVFGEESVFECEADGIIKTKAAHIISTAIKFYFNYKKAIK